MTLEQELQTTIKKLEDQVQDGRERIKRLDAYNDLLIAILDYYDIRYPDYFAPNEINF